MKSKNYFSQPKREFKNISLIRRGIKISLVKTRFKKTFHPSTPETYIFQTSVQIGAPYKINEEMNISRLKIKVKPSVFHSFDIDTSSGGCFFMYRSISQKIYKHVTSHVTFFIVADLTHLFDVQSQ